MTEKNPLTMVQSRCRIVHIQKYFKKYSKTMALLKEKNAHPRDARISFVDSSHTYYIDGSSEGYISSTTLVHTLFPRFDADLIIKKMMRSKNWCKSPYRGMTPDNIKKSWDDNRDTAARMGTAMHENIEMYYNSRPHETRSKEFRMFTEYVEDHENLVPFRTEWEIFDDVAKVAGSVDMLYEDPDEPGSIIIADWKRSKAIKSENRWQKGTDVLTGHLDDCNLVHYSMQLALYKNILQNRYDQKVSKTFLVILHPNQESYLKIETLDMDEVIQKVLDRRMGIRVAPPAKPEVERPTFQFSGCTVDEFK